MPIEKNEIKSPTILVVDDDNFFRRLCTSFLLSEGYQVETAISGNEAILRLREGGIDIVLTDMVMPGISGLEVVRLARNMENPPEVILVTGHATVETAIQALKSGARDYLIKPFNPEELRHLIRTCLEQRRLLDENTLLKSQINLFRKGQNLAFSLDIEHLLPQIVSTFLNELEKDRGFAFLFSENQLSQVYGNTGIDDEQATPLADHLFPKIRGKSGIQLFHKKDELIPPHLWPQGTNSFGVFPLHHNEELRGAVVIFDPPVEDFPSHDLFFLFEQAVIGFENAYRYQGAKELMYTDDLTGLYNYRYLQVILDQELNRGERYGLEFSLVFIDLDHFKNINDTYGHLTGSSVLKEVSGLLRKSVRGADILFRYGGDEFTALLVETGSSGAKIVSERIRQAIEEHAIIAETGETIKLTATVGYATFPENARDQKGIIDLADRAMYHGKKVRNVSRGAWELEEE